VFCEGPGKVSQLFKLTRGYGMLARSPRRWDSIAPKRELALRAAREWKNTARQTRVLYLDDFDPDGVDEFLEAKEEAEAER
jgi:hypothetical protein